MLNKKKLLGEEEYLYFFKSSGKFYRKDSDISL